MLDLGGGFERSYEFVGRGWIISGVSNIEVISIVSLYMVVFCSARKGSTEKDVAPS